MPPLIKKGPPTPTIFLREGLCLAKSHQVRGAGRYPGINVFLHCRVSGLVAIEMLRRLHQSPSDYGMPSLGAMGAAKFLSRIEVCGVSQPNTFESVRSSGIYKPWWPASIFMRRTAETLLEAR